MTSQPVDYFLLVPLDPNKRYLYLQICGGKAFLEHLQDPEPIPGRATSMFKLHVKFREHRFTSQPVPCSCDPDIQEGTVNCFVLKWCITIYGPFSWNVNLKCKKIPILISWKRLTECWNYNVLGSNTIVCKVFLKSTIWFLIEIGYKFTSVMHFIMRFMRHFQYFSRKWKH